MREVISAVRYSGWNTLILAAALATAAAVLFVARWRPREAEKSAAARYLLVEQSGRVAVCASDADGARELTAIRVELLPSADREELCRGIPAADAPALARLLEDLGS